jgi:hypothetical protein
MSHDLQKTRDCKTKPLTLSTVVLFLTSPSDHHILSNWGTTKIMDGNATNKAKPPTKV